MGGKQIAKQPPPPSPPYDFRAGNQMWTHAAKQLSTPRPPPPKFNKNFEKLRPGTLSWLPRTSGQKLSFAARCPERRSLRDVRAEGC